MTIRYSLEAEGGGLLEVAYWVEQQNTEGSGERYIDKFQDRVASYAIPNASYALCHNEILKALFLSCISIDDWIVAFSISGRTLTVHYILYGPGLK